MRNDDDNRFRGAFSLPTTPAVGDSPRDPADDSPTAVIPRITEQTEIPVAPVPPSASVPPGASVLPVPPLASAPPVPPGSDAPTAVIPRIVEPVPGPVPAPVPEAKPKPKPEPEPKASPPVQWRLRLLSGFGEVLITLGAVMALYVVYTLWWTNVQAHKAASAESNKIQQEFQQQLHPSAGGTTGAQPPPTTFSPSEGFGLMTIPAIGKTDIPIMEGTDKEKVLDKGAVGHYTTPKTAMPWDGTGNFAVAAHRRTYGEPFRYINELKPGDHVVVETSHGWFVYTLDKELPQTDPANVGTIAPVPKGGPFSKPGRYITLTTCTPEWASTYRLIWWGHLERVDPLSGPPPAELRDPDRRG